MVPLVDDVVLEFEGGLVIRVTRFFVKNTDGLVLVNGDVFTDKSVGVESALVEIVTLFNV